MKTRIGSMIKVGAVVASLALVGTACGGDDGGGGSSDVDKVTESLLASAEKDGVAVDEGCVRDNVGAYSEADLSIIVDNLDSLNDDSVTPEDLGLSEEGLANLQSISGCVIGS